MTIKDFRLKISETKEPKWFNSVIITLKFPQINISRELKGFSTIYKYIDKQVKGWEKIEKEEIPNELKSSKKYFVGLRNQIIIFLNSNSNENENVLINHWAHLKHQLELERQNIFTFDSPETKFLLNIHKTRPKLFRGAFDYLSNSHNIGSKDAFTGTLLAYEFSTIKDSELVMRKNAELDSLNKISSDFQTQISNSETQLIEHISNVNEKYKVFAKAIDEFKKEKEEYFNEWFEKASKEFSSFDETSKNKIKDLEKTYTEILRLKKPAEYWKLRASKLKKEGWKAVTWLIILILIACTTLFVLLWVTPEGMIKSFEKGNASAIKWSIIYITFVSFLVFGIRILNRVAFSSFHLARDAEEREQLTYVYLALIKDSEVDEKHKHLIMQSLFSRADTGLLKEDSSPTMPNDFMGKLIGK